MHGREWPSAEGLGAAGGLWAGQASYNVAMRTAAWTMVGVLALGAAGVRAQTPQPFPRPGGAASTPPVAQPSPVQAGAEQAPPAVPPEPAPATGSGSAAPALDMPIYPTAQFLTSYDAGRGQRYYLFGATASFADLVTYYRAQLRDRGTLVFDDPPTHMFDVGRFRAESMAFPPSVTVKDWTFGGSQGYPNPVPGAQPSRFPSVIVVVPPPPGATR